MKVDKIKELVLSDEIKVVSFDVFDTLIYRPVVNPVDLFNIIGYRTEYGSTFKDMRVMAERIAKINRPYYHNEVTLSEIYDKFAELTHITREEAKVYENMECEVEREYVFPRQTIKELYDLALELGKKIIIVSDMYLSTSQIIDMLDKCGYKHGDGGYSNIYVSGDERLTKLSGLLYEKVIADLSIEGIEASEILHIGDNYKSDFVMAQSKGIVAGHIRKCSDSFNKNPQLKNLLRNIDSKISYNSYDDSGFIYGALMCYLFDNPDERYSTTSLCGNNEKSLRNLGAIVFAPFVLELCKWIVEDMNKFDKDKLLLVMRDGYVLDKVLKILKNSYDKFPEVEKVYGSRMLLHPLFGTAKAGLAKLIATRPLTTVTTVGEIIKNYLFAEEGSDSEQEALEIFRYHGLKSKDVQLGKVDEFYTYMHKFEEMFLNNSKNSIGHIKQYYNSFFNAEDNLAVFDISYTNSFSRMLKDDFDKENTGYSPFGKPKMDYYRKNGYDLKSLIEYSNATTLKYKHLNFIIEHVFSSQEGSVTGLKMVDGKPKFTRKKVDVFDEIEQIQLGVFDFIKYFINMFEKDFKYLTFDKTCFYENIIEFISNPTNQDTKLLGKVTFNVNHHKDTVFNYGTLNMISRSNSENNGNTKKEDLTIFEMLDEEISNIENVFDTSKNNDTVIFVGGMPAFDKGSCNYINLLDFYSKNTNCLFLNTIAIGINSISKKMSTEFLYMPKFLSKDNYETITDDNKDFYDVNKDIENLINSKSYLKHAIEIIKSQEENVKKGFSEVYVYYCYKYFEKVLEVYGPKAIVIWNVFSANHFIYKNMCDEKGIKVNSMEFGVIPGTFCFEDDGQMGESVVATNTEKFNELVVTDVDVNNTKQILEYLKESKLNRNIQVSFDINKYLEKVIKKDRPVITYFGQNDFESGIRPYTDNSREYHSPIFKNSDEAAIYLSELCKNNNWNFIYKPHPKMTRLNKVNEIFKENGTIVLDKVDINDLIDYSTVNVTILSQTAYISLIREKATLMLGYNQLRDKNCAYEAYEKENIETVLKEAIEKGFTNDKKDNFINHVARLNKYYLYDDLNKKPFDIGNNINSCMEFLELK